MTDVEFWVPKDHLLRKIEKVMDYDWLYERLSPYYCAYNERSESIRGVLIKMALLEHLCGLPSLRQTHRDIEKCSIPMVSGIRPAGKDPAPNNCELCVLQAVSIGDERGYLCAHSEQGAEHGAWDGI